MDLRTLALNLSRFTIVGGAKFRRGIDPILEPLLLRMATDPLPDELQEYLGYCTPCESYEVSAGWIASAPSIADQFAPDAAGIPNSLELGFFTFAWLDGMAIHYSTHDGHVYVREGNGEAKTAEDMLKYTYLKFDSINHFLVAAIDEAIEACADREEAVPPELVLPPENQL